MNRKNRTCAGVLALAAWIPIAAMAQSNVKVPDDVKSAATMAVPIDPATARRSRAHAARSRTPGPGVAGLDLRANRGGALREVFRARV